MTTVAYDARRRGEEVHMGNLVVDDSRRKYIARVVFQGNRVINRGREAAMLQDVGSAPPP